jgi:hypothetical protein
VLVAIRYWHCCLEFKVEELVPLGIFTFPFTSFHLLLIHWLCRLVVRVLGYRTKMYWSIYICYVEESRTPLWSSGQSYWLQIQRSGFDSRSYRIQIFWAVVGLERGPLSLESTTEELLERRSSGSGPEIREYGSRVPSRWPRGILYPQKLALT